MPQIILRAQKRRSVRCGHRRSHRTREGRLVANKAIKEAVMKEDVNLTLSLQLVFVESLEVVLLFYDLVLYRIVRESTY
jgi:hypothetical protein